jgi:fibronectin-binding autotransporter adhesin
VIFFRFPAFFRLSRQLPGRLRLPRSPLAGGAFAIVLGIAATSVQAQTWTNPGTGDWFNPANWSTNSVPTNSTIPALDRGTASIANGTALADSLQIGNVSGSVGGLFIGADGVLTNRVSAVGYSSGSTGQALVHGLGASWTMTSSLTVGLMGTGVVTISDGAQVRNGYGALGSNAGSKGTLTVSGANSQWTATEHTYIGSAGTGELIIRDGGKATVSSISVGDSASGIGSVLVTGAGSTWVVGGGLDLGRLGTATLTMEEGGKIANSSRSRLGVQAGSSATATLNTGAEWANASTFDVGYFSNATVSLQGGSKLTSTAGTVGGSQTGVTGSMSLAGGSSWIASDQLTVGYFGTGTLNISSGSIVSNTSGRVGYDTNAVGTVNVTGPGSLWQNTTALQIGLAGQGRVILSDGGTLSVASGTGTVILGARGELVLGQGGAAGIVNAASITASTTGKITFNHSESGYVFAPAVASATSLVFAGTGNTILAGANSYNGSTTVRAGTVSAGAAHVLSPNSALFLNQGATLNLAGHNQTVGDLDSYNFITGANDRSTVILGGATLTNQNRVTNNWAGSLTGTGTFVKKGAEIMNWYAANTFAGTLQVDGGTLNAQAANVLSPHAVASVASAGTLALNGFAQTTAGLAGAGKVTLGAGSLTVAQAGDSTFNGVISGTGAVTKTGVGTLSLSGSNTFSGGLTIAEGTVRATSNQALGHSSGKITVQNGTLALAGTFNSTRAISLTGAATLANTQTNTLSGVLSGTGSLMKSGAGSLTLTGANTYTGGTTVTSGTLRAGNVNAFGTGTVRVDLGTLDLNGRALGNALDVRGGTVTGLAAYTGTQTVSAAMTYNGTIGGTTIVTQGGTLNTTGATFTGATTIRSGGRVSGIGSLAALTLDSGAILAPGHSPGTLQAGNTVWHGGATYAWEIDDTLGTAGTNWDLLTVTGTLTIAATAENPFTISMLSLTSGHLSGPAYNFNATQDSAYRIATASGGIFGFDSALFSIDSTGFTNGLAGGRWSLAQSGNDLNLVFTSASAVPEPSTYAAALAAVALCVTVIRRRKTG